MKNYLDSKHYQRARAKMQIALTSAQYNDDDEKRALVVKYYRQLMYNIAHNKPLPARPF